MKNKKPYKPNKRKATQANEPQAAYGKSTDKTIRFFSSVEFSYYEVQDKFLMRWLRNK